MKEEKVAYRQEREKKEKKTKEAEKAQRKKKISPSERKKAAEIIGDTKKIDKIHRKISDFIKEKEKAEKRVEEEAAQSSKNSLPAEIYVEAKEKSKAEEDEKASYNDVVTEEKHSWEEYGLKKELLEGIKKKGFVQPSPVQAAAIPYSLKGSNIAARAKNGTGKTGAFIIPLLNKIDGKKNQLQALVLVPTRELVLQTIKVIREIGQFIKIRMLPLYGGVSTKDDVIRLKSGAHIIVGTPGRVLDFVLQRVINLDKCKYLICDEADKLLNREFKEILCQITDMLPEKKQIELYSATFPCKIQDYVDMYMNNTVKINLMGELTLHKIKQYYAYVKPADKLHCLKTLLAKIEINQCFIFCNSIVTVERLAKRMTEMGFVTYFIHSRMKQEERNIVFHNFSTENKCKILVCTDLVTRGIDVPNVNVVINFDLPWSLESYLHRIGRSGRFGREGTAINMITPADVDAIRDIESRLSIKLVPFSQKN